MKSYELSQICDLLAIKIPLDKQALIKNIKLSVLEINNNTLIFHMQKTQTLNIDNLLKLNDCFIITDQPLLKRYHRAKERFLIVPNIEVAYAKFIEFYRNQFSIKTVAITGTCGKSTTKEMIKQVLAKNHSVTGTIGSKNSLRFNHEYLMEIDEESEFGIYETAITDPGQILYSAKYFKPTVGVITNIGIDHLSGCKTLDNYILAKGEILTALGPLGTVIINKDDENINKLDFTSYKGKVITYGIKTKADYQATKISYHNKMMCFTVNNQYQVKVPGMGIHNVYNALAAIATLVTLGIDISEAITELSTYQPMKSHFEIYRGINGAVIVDDTWSSNPTSVEAALDTLRLIKGKKVVVIGNISYLGAYALEQAKSIGKMVVENNIDYLITIDNFSRHIANEAIRIGMDKNNIFDCQTTEDLDTVLYHLMKPGVTVLFKTSMFDKKIKKIIERYFVRNKE